MHLRSLALVVFVFFHSISLSASEITSEGLDELTIYTARWCHNSKAAREYLTTQGIPFNEYDIELSKEGRAAYRKFRSRKIPIITLNNKRLHGFDVSSFEAFVARSK